jgi:succinate dehydrogenase / fumarate reductase iron-sulfur subunit
MVINGRPRGPQRATTACQLHLRHFRDGDTIDVEPWRSRAFPVLKDLAVDRGALDRIIAAGGYITAPTGSAPDAHAVLVPKEEADTAFDAATRMDGRRCRTTRTSTAARWRVPYGRSRCRRAADSR